MSAFANVITDRWAPPVTMADIGANALTAVYSDAARNRLELIVGKLEALRFGESPQLLGGLAGLCLGL